MELKHLRDKSDLDEIMNDKQHNEDILKSHDFDEFLRFLNIKHRSKIKLGDDSMELIRGYKEFVENFNKFEKTIVKYVHTTCPRDDYNFFDKDGVICNAVYNLELILRGLGDKYQKIMFTEPNYRLHPQPKNDDLYLLQYLLEKIRTKFILVEKLEYPLQTTKFKFRHCNNTLHISCDDGINFDINHGDFIGYNYCPTSGLVEIMLKNYKFGISVQPCDKDNFISNLKLFKDKSIVRKFVYVRKDDV